MELKIWVEGIQRIVCGVTDKTTCQDVVYALAHATGKTGRFTLVERWRKNERLLAPNENPLKVLLKWGEYSNDVQFILQRTPLEGTPSQDSTQHHSPAKDIKKSLTFSGGHSDVGRVGVVRGIPQRKPPPSSPNLKKGGKFIYDGSASVQDRAPPPYREPPRPMSPEQRTMAPPPYRDPPPPIYSPSCSPAPSSAHSVRVSPQREPETRNNRSPKPKRSLLKEYRSPPDPSTSTSPAQVTLEQDKPQHDTQCRELIRLIKNQQDKINTQQGELAKCDADITSWEEKAREQQKQVECVTQEIGRLDGLIKHNQEQLRVLNHLESETDIVHQQEKTLQSEMTLLRSKVSNCETELLQCKNKTRLLLDDLQNEQRALTRHEEREISLRKELERLQGDLDVARRENLTTDDACHMVEIELHTLEESMASKREMVERLVQDMKEANLLSLSIVPSEELRLLVEGSHKTGSARKIVGSPRQLETAVPTSKNPHGVWV